MCHIYSFKIIKSLGAATYKLTDHKFWSIDLQRLPPHKLTQRVKARAWAAPLLYSQANLFFNKLIIGCSSIYSVGQAFVGDR